VERVRTGAPIEPEGPGRHNGFGLAEGGHNLEWRLLQALCPDLHCQGDAVVRGVVLQDLYVLQSCCVIGHDVDILPDATGSQLRSPIPSKVAWFLTDPATAVKLVLADPPGWQGPLAFGLLPHVFHGRSEFDFDGVLSLSQDTRDIKRPFAEHVVRIAQLLAVQSNVGDRVQPLAAQEHSVMGQKVSPHGKGATIHPVRFTHPQHLKLVISVVGIRNEPGREEIGVDASRHGCGDGLALALLVQLPRTVERKCPATHHISLQCSARVNAVRGHEGLRVQAVNVGSLAQADAWSHRRR